MTQTEIYALIAGELGAAAWQVEAAVKLIDEGKVDLLRKIQKGA